MMWNYGPYGYCGSSFGFGSMGFMMLFFWALVIALIFLLVRGFKHSTKGDSAVQILKERYAKGEITAEQFEKMKQDLLK